MKFKNRKDKSIVIKIWGGGVINWEACQRAENVLDLDLGCGHIGVFLHKN